MNTEEIKELINSNNNYWEKRALENKLNIIENEEDYVKRLESIYNYANKQIDEKLAVIYKRYSENNELTLKQAYKKLPKEIEKNYKNDLMKYIEEARRFNGDEKWRKYLLNQSLMKQHTVLDQLRTEYRNVVYNIDIENTQGKFLEKIYKNANYYEQYRENQITNENPFTMIDEEKVLRLLKENWSGGGNFSELIWKNKELLVKALDDIVIKGLAVGDSFNKISKELSKKMGTSFNNAKRLVMTESARMDNEGLLDWYKKSGVEKLTFVATLDSRTSEICRAMDGNIFKIEDARIGLNVPPLHPYCRSVISPYYEDNEVYERTYKDESGKNKTGKNQTYVEYLENELGDIKGARALASTRNEISELVKAVGTIMEVNKPINNLIIKNNNYEPNLPEEDKHVLLEMKGFKINDINNILSNELEINKEIRNEIEKIDKALDKLPLYQGEVTTDIRIGNNNPLDDMGIGDVWNVKKYLFSTKNNKYYDKTNYRFVITSKSGRDVGKKVNNYNVNKEVIFKRNSKFIINDIKVKKEVVYYYLEELV